MRSRIAGRVVLIITVLAALIAACGAVVLASASWALGASSAPDPLRGLVAGQVFKDPPDADVNAGTDGDLTITLDAADMRYELGGKWAWGQAYDTSSLVPTIRFDPGAQVSVRLVNHLPVATRVSFHGLHMAASGSGPGGGNPMCVAPGASSTFHLVIPVDHPQGTYWYHSHVMPSCSSNGGSGSGTQPRKPLQSDGDGQVFTGLSGALIVGDDRLLLPTAYRGVAAHTFVLQNAGGSTVRVVNGQLRPILAMRPNETQLWRLVNAGTDQSYRLRMDGYRFTVIGEDGTPKAGGRPDTLVLPPGKRYDVLVTAGARSAKASLRTTSYSTGPQGSEYSDIELVRVDVCGHAVEPLPALGAGATVDGAPLAAPP